MNWINPRSWYDAFRGAGTAAVTVPPMDGTLRPNNRLDAADRLWQHGGARVDNLAVAGGSAWFSAGEKIYRLTGDFGVEHAADVSGPVYALAARGDGALAVAGAEHLLLLRPDGSSVDIDSADVPLNCTTALSFAGDDALVIANGSAHHGPADWCRDLMEKGRSGSLWRLGLDGGKAERLADRLAFPAGIAIASYGGVVCTESWQHRLLRFAKDGRREVILDELPGYPGRLATSGDGGFWLSIFAPRRQIFEFVLREDGYRQRMMETFDPQYWVSPVLRSEGTYLEPVQSGGVRHLGQIKPWAPTRSYGLLARLGPDGGVRDSAHSRADGKRHGITSAVTLGDRVVCTCAATNEILALDLDWNDE